MWDGPRITYARFGRCIDGVCVFEFRSRAWERACNLDDYLANPLVCGRELAIMINPTVRQASCTHPLTHLVYTQWWQCVARTSGPHLGDHTTILHVWIEQALLWISSFTLHMLRLQVFQIDLRTIIEGW